MGELIYKDLSYKIIGCVYKSFNELGFGYREKIYQRALAEEFKKERIHYKSESPAKLIYNGKIIGKYFLDFVVEDKVILELKIANDFYTRDIKQILGYLKAKNLRLGILIILNRKGIKYRRIVN